MTKKCNSDVDVSFKYHVKYHSDSVADLLTFSAGLHFTPGDVNRCLVMCDDRIVWIIKDATSKHTDA